ncbi:MAG: hypothetical protein AB8B73_08475 [Ekhidna sp.]
MNRIFTLVKYDYLQRVRSYQFLIIVCASLAFAYTLIPAPDSSYSTIRIGGYLGNYNAPWVGYVSAIMSSVFVTLIGYYLINSSIRIDQTTNVGQIIAATSIPNFHYLLAKFLGNLLILLSVLVLILIVSILLFFMYGSGYSFEITPFLSAYLLIPVPSIVFISALAVVLEVLIGNKPILQNGVFFVLFMMLLVQGNAMDAFSDPFGTNFPTREMEKQVDQLDPSAGSHELNMGFIFSDKSLDKRFEFSGINAPISYILFRISWALSGLFLILLVSKFFHRFELKKSLNIRKKKVALEQKIPDSTLQKEVDLAILPNVGKTMSIFPVFKMELLMMLRKGPKWLWLLNIGGMIALMFMPIEPAHKMALPILWFLQIQRLADLVTKEKSHHMHYFIFSSFKPVQRVLSAQWLAAVTLTMGLALPLILRYVFLGDLIALASIIIGAMFIIALSSFIGISTGGKRLFEVLFFFIAYMNVNGLPFTDYFGAFYHSTGYLVLLSCLTIALGVLSVLLRRWELSRV